MLKRSQVEQPDGVLAQKRLAADICCRMATHACQNEHNLQQAIKFHREALVYCEDDVKVGSGASNFISCIFGIPAD